MREKVLKLVLSFQDLTQAMAAEKLCKEREIPGRLIPLPGEISEGCGLAWCTELQEREKIEMLLEKRELEFQGIHEIFLYETGKRKTT